MKIWAEFVAVDGKLTRLKLFFTRRDVDQSRVEDFGLTLEEGKSVLRRVKTATLARRTR